MQCNLSHFILIKIELVVFINIDTNFINGFEHSVRARFSAPKTYLIHSYCGGVHGLLFSFLLPFIFNALN